MFLKPFEAGLSGANKLRSKLYVLAPEKEFEEFRVAGLRPMGVSVRTHLSSQDSQFNLFIGFSVEDMSRTVWMGV